MKTKIKLVRIDKRLLHATVALNWNQFIDADYVLIVNPGYVNDPFMVEVMNLCLPKTMKVKIFSIEQFLAFLHADHNIKVMIIFPNLTITCNAVQAGFRTEELQLPYPASRMMMKHLSDYFDEKEIEQIRYIQDQGIRMFFQTAPFDNKDYSIFKKIEEKRKKFMFEGIITPIVTPFYRDAEQSINYEATKQLIEHLIQKGVQGIFILGSNGEFHVLDEEEKIEFAKQVVAFVNHRIPVYAGAGCCSTKASIRLSKKLEATGVDALSVITPYFLKLTDEELYEHFKEIAGSVHIPILLYNIPKVTGCNIPVEVVARLADIKSIRGIKDSSGDEENLKAYLEVSKQKDFHVLIGSDSKISFGYTNGASGAVAGTSNVITDVLVKLNYALRTADTLMADRFQKDIDVLRSVLKLGTVPSIMKRSMELADIANVGPARKPVRECNSEEDQKIKEMLHYYGLI